MWVCPSWPTTLFQFFNCTHWKFELTVFGCPEKLQYCFKTSRDQATAEKVSFTRFNQFLYHCGNSIQGLWLLFLPFHWCMYCRWSWWGQSWFFVDRWNKSLLNFPLCWNSKYGNYHFFDVYDAAIEWLVFLPWTHVVAIDAKPWKRLYESVY